MALPVIHIHIVVRDEYHLYDETLSPHKNCPVCHPKPSIMAKSRSPVGTTGGFLGWEVSPSGTKMLIRKKRKILVRSNEISRKKGAKVKKLSALNSGLAPPIKM